MVNQYILFSFKANPSYQSVASASADIDQVVPYETTLDYAVGGQPGNYANPEDAPGNYENMRHGSDIPPILQRMPSRNMGEWWTSHLRDSYIKIAT